MIRTFTAAIAGLAMLGLAGVASAEEASGKITAADPSSRVIQLEDGSVFEVGQGVAMDALQPGTEVKVSFEEQDGRKVATEVTPQ